MTEGDILQFLRPPGQKISVIIGKKKFYSTRLH